MQLPQTNCLEISVESGILNLMINNPPNNYLPAEFFEELNRCRDLILSPEVAAVIFTGKGKVFSKGVDIQGITAQSNSLDQSMVVFANKVFTFLSRLEKPVIAAINGACLGGGLELALACHIRLCSEKARIGLPELSIGLIPGLGGIQRLVRVVGEAKALEMILLGDMISAARAHELNLVSRIFPQKDFYAKVLIFVRTILTAGREALAEALRLIALSRADKEEGNVARAAESFARLISQILAERPTGV